MPFEAGDFWRGDAGVVIIGILDSGVVGEDLDDDVLGAGPDVPILRSVVVREEERPGAGTGSLDSGGVGEVTAEERELFFLPPFLFFLGDILARKKSTKIYQLFRYRVAWTIRIDIE